ncbi:MAG: ABC transporter ATP-binding protein [Rhodospirillaceae bacterium]
MSQLVAPVHAVSVRGLTKVYAASGRGQAREALKAIDLAIPRGSLFGLLGPNGAGKSTLINILAGLVNKTAGEAAIWGFDIERQFRHARSSIGVVPQELNIDPFFTPRELLDLQAGFYGVPAGRRRTGELLEAVGLTSHADAYARTLSGGMRRRLMVAKAMVHAPPVLVLDEPSAGVDVELRRQLWAHVRELNRRGTTVLLTTHYLEEAEQLCDTIAIINHGQVVACEATRTLIGQLDRKELTIIVDRDMAAVPPALAALAVEGAVELEIGRRLVVRYRPSRVRIDAILTAVQISGLAIVDLTTEEADLEDIFLSLTRGNDAGTRDGQDAAAVSTPPLVAGTG